jgi:predicted  nucleic acid-binding Zn-ribbon protein
MEEVEAGFRREWEKLEVERLRLSDWERRLGDHIQVVASSAAEERAQLVQEREVHREKMRRVINRELAVITREKAVARKEQEVELKERSARHAIDTAKAMAKTIDDEQATLNQREDNLSLQESAVKEEEDRLSALRTDLEARTRALEDRRLRQEEESRSLSQRLERLLAEQRAGAQRIAKWVGEASTTLESLRLSPIQVAEAPSSIGAVLPALDSAAERLQRLELTLVARLEVEGRELARMVVDHVLTCFRSHDPTISLTPILEGPAPEVEAVTREGVQEAVEIMAARFERNMEPDL